jgi:predicted phage terminase large subunit-like protein
VHLQMPAVDEACAALWPEYWPLDALEKVRSTVGSCVWQSQYLGAPTPSEGGILKRLWFGQFADVPPSAFLTIQSWDTAFQTGESNDYSACSTLSEGLTGTFLRDVYRKRLGFPDLERMVIQQYERMRPSAVLIEDKASGPSLIQSLRRKTSIPIIAVDVPNTKDWKTQRINELAPYVETWRFHLPIAASWLDDTVHELTAFPFATHDDIADSVAQGLRRLLQREHAGGGTSSYLPDVDDEDGDDRW